MSFSKANTTANTLSTSATTNVKRGDSKTCTPFTPASNTNTSIVNSKVQANAVRKPGQSTGLKVVTNAGNSPFTPVTADTVTSEGNTPASSVSVSISATAYPSDEENVRPAQDQDL
ncbi:hypothetical protein GALMADRAFT_390404 [Galerina marginata CBS 339.88]|uniref:Uncharacterized protein n=1 Tax=Galerina marginata (strain CBS 339.88) TaxID=685588 RepID=A0A067TRL9_GALM3|nr:hypothetical protein GALMADRAFT_390404 [Galerina marginata CBS 339.88]